MEGLLKDIGNKARLHHRYRPFGHRLRNRCDIDGLKVFLVEPGARRLPGDAQDRNGIGGCRIKAGDHIRSGRAGGADTDADIAGFSAGITLGHMRGTLDVTRQDVADRAARPQRRIKRIDRRPRNTKGAIDPFLLQDTNCRINGTHFCHDHSSRFWWNCNP